MAGKFEAPPRESKMVERDGFVSQVWHMFLVTVFGKILARLEALEATSTDHEERIEALEP